MKAFSRYFERFSDVQRQELLIKISNSKSTQSPSLNKLRREAYNYFIPYATEKVSSDIHNDIKLQVQLFNLLLAINKKDPGENSVKFLN